MTISEFKKQMQESGTQTASKKDNSPRGYVTVSVDDIKEGDSVILNNTITEITADEPAAPRPVYYGQKGRALVHYWRACNCYKLAERKGTPTAEAVETATNLYNRLIRYALADAHQWEYENTSERYANSKQAESDRARLDKRRANLEKELTAYGLRLYNYGLYPSIIDSDGRHEIELIYFD